MLEGKYYFIFCLKIKIKIILDFTFGFSSTDKIYKFKICEQF